MRSSAKDRLAALWDHPEVQRAVEATQDPTKHDFVEDPAAPDSCFSCGKSAEAHDPRCTSCMQIPKDGVCDCTHVEEIA